MNKVYTIGYEGKDIDKFLELLEERGVSRLIDVRSSPRSRKEDFNQENLKDELFQKSIMYKHLPELGGLREDYEEVMEGEDWEDGFEELKKLAKEGKTVLMCLEEDPMKCHRKYIAEELEKEGWDVVHISEGGAWKEKSLDDF
ncbi:MAG: DUF488 domain-containing protein [Candidatus Thermoplasmatota archaeon]